MSYQISPEVLRTIFLVLGYPTQGSFEEDMEFLQGRLDEGTEEDEVRLMNVVTTEIQRKTSLDAAAS